MQLIDHAVLQHLTLSLQKYEGGKGLAFHFDKDEHALQKTGDMVHPQFSSVVYLTGERTQPRQGVMLQFYAFSCPSYCFQKMQHALSVLNRLLKALYTFNALVSACPVVQCISTRSCRLLFCTKSQITLT